MMTILEWQAHVGIIVGNIILVMHNKKFPKRHIHHRAVFCIMLKQQRKPQKLMKFS